MKITGMVMITAFSSCLGLMVANNKKKRIAYIDNLIYIGSYISLMLSSTLPDTNEIMSALRKDERLTDFDFNISSRTSPLSSADNERIISLFANLGKYDADTLLKLTDEFTGYFGMVKKDYQENYEKCYRLYIVFGISSGLLISILLI